MNTESFFDSAALRQAIYFKKEVLKLSYPWSDDARFNSDFFCNVFRWQDKTTKRILEAAKADIGKLLVYRSVSRISTVDYLEEHWDGSSVLGLNCALHELSKHSPVHTGAFFIWPVPGHARWELPGMLLERLDIIEIYNASVMQDVFEYLRRLPGVGYFMAYEYATDISYLIPYPDEKEWASFGPGALRGISRILYKERRPLPKGFDALAFGKELYDAWSHDDHVARMSKYLPEECAIEAARPFYKRLTMREVEHWLCEYDKYKRSTRNKRRYP